MLRQQSRYEVESCFLLKVGDNQASHVWFYSHFESFSWVYPLVGRDFPSIDLDVIALYFAEEVYHYEVPLLPEQRAVDRFLNHQRPYDIDFQAEFFFHLSL